MKAALIQILMGAIGTLGFSIYFRVSERNVAAATFGGALGWGVYLLCFHLWGNVFCRQCGGHGSGVLLVRSHGTSA